MSYAIIRNTKLTREQANGAYRHNERKTKKHSNKDIDISKTELNYYIKQNELSYTKEFDRIKEKYDLQGHIRSNSVIMCEMVFTSDQKFFDEIGYEESKRFFMESYDFICKYKDLGEQNIVSAVVHNDETTPHMHLLFIPVVHTKDEKGNKIDKICSRDFWKGRNSYRDLQNAYFKHIKEKGFNLERGELVEETKREHYSVEKFKNITNFEETKKVLSNIKLELPETPNVRDFRKLILNRDEKIEELVVKPRDELIQKLYSENVSLHKELTKQAELVDTAQILENKQLKMLEDNANLKFKCYKLEEKLEDSEREFEIRLSNKAKDIEQEYKKEIKDLNKEVKYLNTVIDRFKVTIKKFIKWICRKFSYPSEDEIVRAFERETNIFIDPVKQIAKEKREKEWDREL